MKLGKAKNTGISESQREMRSAFQGGFAGQLVSGLIWLGASTVSVFVSQNYGMAFLFFGSMGIFPLTQLMLRLIGRPAKVPDIDWNRPRSLWPRSV